MRCPECGEDLELAVIMRVRVATDDDGNFKTILTDYAEIAEKIRDEDVQSHVYYCPDCMEFYRADSDGYGRYDVGDAVGCVY